MKTIVKLLQLQFLPRHADLGLLVLRLWLGASMLLLHGWAKLTHFGELSQKFPDPIGLGSVVSLGLAVFAESFCSVLVVLGLFTRFAALNLAVTMSVAFFGVHKMVLKGQGSGELAFIYLAGCVALVVAGGGRFALDPKLGGKN